MSEASVLSEDGIQAVASTVINRIYSKDFPNTFHEVMYQKYAFSVINDGRLFSEEPTERVKKAMRKAIYEDNSYGSLFFVNVPLAIRQGYSKNASWMINNLEETVKHGNVTFLK